MKQFLRKTRVTFFGPGGFVVNPSDNVANHELRVSFKSSKSISGTQNTLEINLWNLNANHRNSIGKELEKVQVEAGYAPVTDGTNVSIISEGFIRDVQHEKVGPDIITTVFCGDGDEAHRKATISKTYEAGTPVKDVVQGLYDEMKKHGVNKGEWKFPEDIRTMKRPFSMCGACVRELNNLGRGNGFYWSIQNSVMEIIPSDGYLAGQVLISAETGMVGAPTITDNGVKVKCLLNPAIRPNRTVKVKSSILEMNSKDDVYRVSALDIQGDNMRGEFVCVVHGESIIDGKVDEGVLK